MKSKAKAAVKAKTKKKPAKLKKATDARDITELMIRDHKPLKRLIKLMKKSDSELPKLRSAFQEFAPLLEAHAKPEEKSLYVHMDNHDEDDIRVEGREGETEHSIADQLASEIKQTQDEDKFRARVKVLAELVEHHIEEEEEDMIPDLREEMTLEERVEIGEEYIRIRSEFLAVDQAA